MNWPPIAAQASPALHHCRQIGLISQFAFRDAVDIREPTDCCFDDHLSIACQTTAGGPRPLTRHDRAIADWR
jgi:hypothetical protein